MGRDQKVFDRQGAGSPQGTEHEAPPEQTHRS